MTTKEFTGYVNLLSSLAVQSLRQWAAEGADGSPADERHEKATAKPGVASISLAVAPALFLATKAAGGAPADEWEDIVPLERMVHVQGTWTDPAGHARPVYRYLAIHLFLTASQHGQKTRKTWCDKGKSVLSQMAQRLRDETETAVDLALWQGLCRVELAMLLGDAPRQVEVLDGLETWVSAGTRDGELHRMTAEDSLDAWTWRELVGLGALDHLAVLAADRPWRARCDGVVKFHLENTQPDNTTTQPWGVAAFLATPWADTFGQQQIHDATAQGRGGSGGGVGLVAAMLMADAAMRLAGLAER